MITTNKRATESFIVAAAGATTIPTSGTLNNTTTGNVNLTNGQIGVISADLGGSVAPYTFVDATPTLAEAPVIQFVQGTSASASVANSQGSATYPLWARPFEYTNRIDGRNKGIRVTKQAFRPATHSVWTIGAIDGATSGAINVLDETKYSININYRGYRLEETYSSEQSASLRSTITTPDFTALATAEPLDWIVSHFVYDINRNSEYFQLGARWQGSDPIVAFGVGVALSGPGGTAAGTEIATLTAGSSLNVFVYGGVTRTITLTAEMVASIQAAATASSFTHIMTIDLANAGTTTGGTATGIMLMALDSRLAYVDYIPHVKIRLRVNVPAGFDYSTVAVTERVAADEGQGYGRVLDLLYKATQGQRKYAQRHDEDPVINFPSPIDTAQNYTVYNVLHGNSEQVDTFNMVYSPYREIICIPRYSTGTTAHAAIALVDAVWTNWLPSTGNAAMITLD